MTTRPIIDAVEIKANVGGADADFAKQAVGLHDADAKDRDIWFYENLRGIGGPSTLPLLHNHVIVRARRSRDGSGDLTIKVRAEDLVLPDAWCAPDEGHAWKFKVEGDWTNDRHTAAASLTADYDAEHGGRTATPQLSDTVIDRQLDFLHQATELPIDVRALHGLGPISARSWRPTKLGFKRDGVEHEIAAERWQAGDLTFLELSLRVAAVEAAEVQTAFVAHLTNLGISVEADQENKTGRMLRHLADRRP